MPPERFTLTLKGLASGRRRQWTWPQHQQLPPELSLLEFLRQQGIPVASSCDGAGVCRRCVVNEEQLSCELTLADLKRQHGPGEWQCTLSYW